MDAMPSVKPLLALLTTILALGAAAPPAPAQAVIGYHVPMATGWSPIHNPTPAPVASPPVVVTQPGSPWLKLWFSGVNLGVGSAIKVSGALDEAVQVLDAGALASWSSTSAYFNGDTVVVELLIAPQDTATAWIAGYDAGFLTFSSGDSICGPTDDRVLTTEPRVGRLINSSLNVLCSGSLISSNACYLTAGHCVAGGAVYTVEFNCPPSGSNGQPVHPGPEHQYPLNNSTLASLNNGIGNDWAIGRLDANATTGLSAALIQGFYRLAPGAPAVGSTTRVTGFGSAQGIMNFSNKTHTGPSTLVGGATGTQIAYAVDTSSANSGSPVVDEAMVEVYGVHTHAGCNGGGGANNGTLITHAGLQAQYTLQCTPVAPAHSISVTQGGPGAQIVLSVVNAPPNSELFNIVSFTPAVPTDTGTFFGLYLGPGSGDPVPLFFVPLGTDPFHVQASAAGGYLFVVPGPPVGSAYNLDVVSLAFALGTNFTNYHGRSPAVNVTIWL
jgi:hypothetical protein